MLYKVSDGSEQRAHFFMPLPWLQVSQKKKRLQVPDYSHYTLVTLTYKKGGLFHAISTFTYLA